jgi:multicomponent Na+:H+ antiporter subunit D
LLHPWLTDAYPEATITGVIFMSAFTTKCAVYALARAFPGTEALIWIGAIMTGFPIFYAVIENDLRRVLAYSLINQVGFMVCGIGIGTALAINGAVAHVFNDVLFKALLFMSMGAVMYRTGKINGTALGGLYRTMPFTCICCMVGAASISAFPLFSGFVSKSMVMDAAAKGHMRIIWFILLFASAGVFHHAGIKIPFFAFFGHDSGMRPKEAPVNMLLAMGIAAFLCIFIGSFPGLLYSLLPYPVDYVPYTAPHVVGQTQLLFFSALAFSLLLLSGIYPGEQRCVNLDFDWFYRKGSRLFYYVMDRSFNGLCRVSERVFVGGLAGYLGRVSRDGATRAALLAMVPAWGITGTTGEKLARKKASLRAAVQTGTSPVGISAALATIFLIVVFLLM